MPTSSDPRRLAKTVDELCCRITALEGEGPREPSAPEGGNETLNDILVALEARITGLEEQAGDVSKKRAVSLAKRIQAIEARLGVVSE